MTNLERDIHLLMRISDNDKAIKNLAKGFADSEYFSEDRIRHALNSAIHSMAMQDAMSDVLFESMKDKIAKMIPSQYDGDWR